MTQERFRLVEDLFHSALERHPDDRTNFLAESCAGDPELLQSVQSLIGTEPTGHLRTLVASAAALSHSDSLVGHRIGAYEIQGELGSGGMGDVYLAVRADETYRKKVAIKFVKAGWLSSAIQERFRVERQILANLDHPYIARLLDGGAASDGRPYLVMEYVDGLSVIDFSDRHQLSTVQRVELFCRICEAVQYAHQNLIVHRDLKPANIVITNEGSPKLLDFGIAKLLDPTAGGSETQPFGWRMLTPDYASPEQFRGEPVTTATDVYSLGVVLYLLLTGQPVFSTNGKTPADTERLITEQDPERPSHRNATLRGRLGRDLDTVVLKAMRKNPLERYGSVAMFASDLENAVSGLPLKAANYTVWERTLRLAQRYRVGVVAGTLVAASLLAATAISIQFATRAERERLHAEQSSALADQSARRALDQQTLAEASGREADLRRQEADRERQGADASRKVAEDRLRDAHTLAAKVLFDINESLRTLPGATKLRSQTIRTSAEYLDRLVQESGGNAALQQDLASSYMRLAEVTGDPSDANQGDLAGSLALYEKSVAILKPLLAQNPRDSSLRRQMATTQSMLIRVLADSLRGREAEQYGLRAIEIFEGLRNEYPNSEQALEDLAAVYLKMAVSSNSFPDRRKAVHYATLSSEAYSKLVAHNPRAPQPRIGLGDALSQESSAKLFVGDTSGALTSSLEAQRIRRQLRIENPSDRVIAEALMFGYGRLGDIVKQNPGPEGIDYRQSLEYYREANELATVLASKDPGNQRAQQNLAISGYRVAEGLSSLGADEAAIKAFRESLGVFEKLLTTSRNKVIDTYRLAVYVRLGTHLTRLNQRAAAVSAYENILRISQPMIDAGDQAEATVYSYVAGKLGLALEAARRGQVTAGRSTAEAIALSDKYAAAPQSPFGVRTRNCLHKAQAGHVYEALNDVDQALKYHRQAAMCWENLPEANRLRATRLELEAMSQSRETYARLSATTR